MKAFLMNLSSILAVVALMASSANAAAFLNHAPRRSLAKTQQSTPQSSLEMIPESAESIANAAFSNYNNFLLATIDSDIASVPDNEFAPIFAGGILVMFGGVVSALIVGFILDSRDLYANVVADSYAQSAEDEEFWKGLSEEEKKKTQELLAKIKESKDGTPAPSMVQEAKEGIKTEEPTQETSKSEAAPQGTPSDNKDTGMFSDY